MSLFDDLLNQKKPAQTGSGQSSGKQEDPLSVATSIIISASTPLISVAPDPIVIQEMPLMAPETATQTS